MYDPSNPIVCLQLYVKTGSVNEEDMESGYSHFVEHMTFKSTTHYPDNQISVVIPALGGSINAYTEFDTTCYYMVLPSEAIQEGLQVLADLAYQAEFTHKDIQIEKDIILEEIKQYDNEPEAYFIEWIQNSYFATNPLKKPVLGIANSVKGATEAKLGDFYHKHYLPANCFLVVSGCFDTQDIRPQVEALFSAWKNSPAIPDNFPSQVHKIPPECNSFRLSQKTYKQDNSYLAFVIPELVETDKLNDAMQVVARVFASGKKSRLHKRLVEKDKLSHGISLHSISGFYPGITIMQITPASQDVIPDIIYAYYDEWQKLMQSGITPDEMEMVKLEMHHGWLYDFEYVEGHANSLAAEELMGDYSSLYDYPTRINAISFAQVADCLRTYWQPDYLSIYYMAASLLPQVITDNINKLFTTESSKLQIQNTNLPSDVFLQEGLDIQIQEAAAQDCLESIMTNTGITDVRLACGIRLIIKPVHSKPVIGMALTTPVSQLSEPQDLPGINYFTSTLMLYGSEKHDYATLQKYTSREGFTLKVSHTLETTTLKGKCFTHKLPEMLTLAAELTQLPAFPSHYLSILKANSIDYLRREKESPFANAYSNWVKLIFGSQTNLHRSIRNISAVRQITRGDIHDWYNTQYSFSRYTLCLAGDVDIDAAVALCNSLFGSVNTPHIPVLHTPIFKPSVNHRRLITKQTDQATVIMGGMGPKAADTISNTAFHLLAQILGGELSSRFFRILREQYGYAYQTGFDFTSISDLGYWFGYSMCDCEDYKVVEALMRSILQDIRDNGVTQEELTSAQNFLSGMQRLDTESLSWQASSLGILYSLGYDYDYFIAREERIRNVTLSTIHALAQQWLKPENFCTYIEI